MREKDVGVSHKESALAAQWLTKSLAGNRAGYRMNRDRNILTQFSGQKQNVLGEALTLHKHNGYSLSSFFLFFLFFLGARAPVWGNPSKPQQEALMQDKNPATKDTGSLKNLKTALLPLRETAILGWPSFIRIHSACS